MASKSISKTSDLEKQLDAASEAGMVPGLNAPVQPKKKPGRPSTKSKERAPTSEKTPEMLMPEEKKIENDKKVNAIIANAKKRRLICQIRAFSCYFPEVTRDAVTALSLEELNVQQLEGLYNCFRDSVLGASEVTSIPLAIKKLLGKTETTLVGIGMSNPEHPVLGEFIKMNGLASRIERDEEIDVNVKLLSVELVGRLPRSPYLNILQGIVRVGWDLYNECTFQRPLPEVGNDPRYSKLSSNKTETK